MSKIKLSFDAVKPFVDKAGTLAKQGFQSLSKLVQNRDFQKGLKKKERYGEKVRIGKSTLPMTYGDLLALKILGVMAAILLLVLLVLGRL